MRILCGRTDNLFGLGFWRSPGSHDSHQQDSCPNGFFGRLDERSPVRLRSGRAVQSQARRNSCRSAVVSFRLDADGVKKALVDVSGEAIEDEGSENEDVPRQAVTPQERYLFSDASPSAVNDGTPNRNSR